MRVLNATEWDTSNDEDGRVSATRIEFYCREAGMVKSKAGITNSNKRRVSWGLWE